MSFYRNMDKRVQFDFVVHTEEKGAYDDEIIDRGGKIYRAPKYVVTNHFTYKRWWDQFFISHPEYKIVHCHLRNSAFVSLPIAKKHGCFTILHSHNIGNGKGIGPFVRDIFKRGATKGADCLFACSEAAGEWLFKDKRFQFPYYVIKNGIDVERFAFNNDARIAIRKEFEIERNFVVGTVGRLVQQKNPDFTIRIIKELKVLIPEFKFLWVGDGRLEDEIKQSAKERGLLSNIIFTGSRDDMPELLSAMDVFILPSLYEGLGISAIEAQAAGLPCLLSTAIPDDVCISKLANKLSVENEVDEWVDELCGLCQKPVRQDVQREIKESGYEIKSVSRWLSDFYISKAV